MDTRLRIRVQPGARREAVRLMDDGRLRVSVTAPPERGRANEAVLSLLARILGLPRGRVELVRGAASRDKVVVVRDMAPEEVMARLGAG